jgi:hypothetical protein
MPCLPACRSLLVLLLAAPAAFAHTRLIYPPPRDRIAHKTPPCGSARRTDNPTVLTAGAEIVVEWEEFIDHPGYYQILFSPAGDRDFVMLMDDIQDERIPSGSATRRYSLPLVLPAEPCEDGTLLVIQVMTENPSSPALYYSCADIRLVVPEPEVPFRRGDAGGDGDVTLTDSIRTFEVLFLGGEVLPCDDAADANDDGLVNLSDGIWTINWLFLGGPAPSDPGALACGLDAPGDDISCGAYATCPPAG